MQRILCRVGGTDGAVCDELWDYGGGIGGIKSWVWIERRGRVLNIYEIFIKKVLTGGSGSRIKDKSAANEGLAG